MPPTRREFLAALSAATLLPSCNPTAPSPADDDTGPDDDAADDDTGPDPTPVRGSEPEPWAAPGEEDAAAFAWGIVIGDATAAGARVSALTTEASLILRVVRAEGEGWVEHAVVEGIVPAEGAAAVDLAGLAPDTAYSCAFYAADGVRRGPAGRFRTALPEDGYRVVTFGATSCLGDPGRPWPSLEHAAAERLDFLCLLGDAVYADGADSREDYREHWRQALSTAGLRAATASTSIVATWDDHEVDNNWSWKDSGIEARFEAALATFREALPQGIGPGGTGIWRRIGWGRVLDVFVLDCRGERRDGLYVSVEQMEWLKRGLAESEARFKVVLNSVPITELTPLFANYETDDRWAGYPEQRAELLDHIRNEGIEGVVWVSGDIHLGMVAAVDGPGGPGEGQWEVATGPGGSQINPIALLYPPDERFPVLVGVWNWVRFECDPGAGTVAVRFVGDDGAAVGEWMLTP
ncbi:alkaline phosphatase D family protein [Myxococcota bacterium]|nr:alkaline phosphatase D family protein [Myxococcota bacterium]